MTGINLKPLTLHLKLINFTAFKAIFNYHAD